MKFLEKDLEEIIFSTNRSDLEKRGLTINGRLYRQKRIGNYGVADLVSVDRETIVFDGKLRHQIFNITIYELKKEKIGISAFLQALGYLKGVKSFIDKKNLKVSFNYKIVLIGKEIDSFSNYIFLSDFLITNYEPLLENYTYKYDVDGLKFKLHQNYALKNEGFGL